MKYEDDDICGGNDNDDANDGGVFVCVFLAVQVIFTYCSTWGLSSTMVFFCSVALPAVGKYKCFSQRQPLYVFSGPLKLKTETG